MSSFTVPAGQQGTLQSATFFETTGTTVVCALQVVRAATTFNLIKGTANAVFTGPFPLQAGDVVQWNVTTAVAATFADFSIGVVLDQPSQRVTLDLFGKAIIDQGITLHPGSTPLYLWPGTVGDAITEEIRAVANAGTQTIGWWEFMLP